MPNLGWAQPFRSVPREAQFQRQEAFENVKQDLLAAAIFFGLWGFLTLRFWHVISHRHALGQLMGASFYLFPWLWCKMLGVESYTRWRLWVISALRVSAVFFPGFFELVKLQSFPGSLHAWLAATLVASKLPKLLIMSLGFRLPFYLHFLVHAVLLVASLESLPAVCSTPFLRHDSSVGYFHTATYLLSNVEFVSALVRHPGRSFSARTFGENEGQACSCITVLGAVAVFVGYVCPSVFIAVSEKVARAAFVAGRQQEGGWLLADLNEHLHYDWVLPLVLLGIFLPAILGLSWQVALLAAQHMGVC